MSSSEQSIAVVQIRRMYTVSKIILAVLLAPLVLAVTLYATLGIGGWVAGHFGDPTPAKPSQVTTSTTIR